MRRWSRSAKTVKAYRRGERGGGAFTDLPTKVADSIEDQRERRASTM